MVRWWTVSVVLVVGVWVACSALSWLVLFCSALLCSILSHPLAHRCQQLRAFLECSRVAGS